MTSDGLRSRVVLLVVGSIIGLAFGLYLLVGLLLWRDQTATLPGELWLAAGVFGGALVGFLSNSKGGQEGGTPEPVTVTTDPDEPLAVREATDDPIVMPTPHTEP